MKAEIALFWHWFSTVQSDFGDHFENASLLAELDENLSRLGDYGWEVGPGTLAPNALVISPAGRRELLARTREIVQEAPHITGWEFHAAKPPKKWAGTFEMHDDDDRLVHVDASNWTFVMLRYPSGTTEVLVEAPQLDPSLSDAYRRWAAEIAIDALIGEERRLQLIDEVAVTEHMEPAHRPLARPILELIPATAEMAPPKPN